MTLRWRIQTAVEHFWESKVSVRVYRLKASYRGLRARYRRWRMTPEEIAKEEVISKKTRAAIQDLIRALEAGSYNAAPTELKQGCDCYTAPIPQGQALQIEDLAPVMKLVTFEGPRPLPKWWQVWKTWNRRYMRELHEQRERTMLKFRKP
jgi:hypothetical protein